MLIKVTTIEYRHNPPAIKNGSNAYINPDHMVTLQPHNDGECYRIRFVNQGMLDITTSSAHQLLNMLQILPKTDGAS